MIHGLIACSEVFGGVECEAVHDHPGWHYGETTEGVRAMWARSKWDSEGDKS